jgi:hypothetical protein
MIVPTLLKALMHPKRSGPRYLGCYSSFTVLGLLWSLTPLASRAQTPPSAPYPPSPVIRQIVWSPKDTIIRKAHDSDNWPLTWADDDALYTAYGDGSGFEPFVPEKLSLGLARVTGMPPAFTGENLRAPSLEQRGAGKNGRKASGMLCVEGTLYLWARNATNSQLAWSEDHGANWHWADWKFTNSFGCPSFLNFGRIRLRLLVRQRFCLLGCGRPRACARSEEKDTPARCLRVLHRSARWPRELEPGLDASWRSILRRQPVLSR